MPKARERVLRKEPSFVRSILRGVGLSSASGAVGAVVLAAIAWLLWSCGGEHSVDDIAGVYRFVPIPADRLGGRRSEAERINETYELRLNPDGSYASSVSERASRVLGWDIDSWRGRWEIDGSRVILIRDGPVKPPPTVLLIRGDTLVLEAIEKINRGQLEGVGTLRKQ